MKVASNSGPLIHLAQINAISLLGELYKEVVIPRKIKAEAVDMGKKEGCADAVQIERAIRSGMINVAEHAANANFSTFGLHEAEADVTSLSLNEKYDLILLDDDATRELARALGLKVRGSIGVIVDALRKKKISKKEALKFLDKLAGVMYLSGEAYMVAREAIEMV